VNDKWSSPPLLQNEQCRRGPINRSNGTQNKGASCHQDSKKNGGNQPVCHACGEPHAIEDHDGFAEPEEWWANKPENEDRAKKAGCDFDKAKKALAKKKSKASNNANVGEEQPSNDNDNDNDDDDADEEGSQHLTAGQEELTFSFHQEATADQSARVRRE